MNGTFNLNFAVYFDNETDNPQHNIDGEVIMRMYTNATHFDK